MESTTIDRSKRVFANVLDAIGNTPIIKLNHIGSDTGANVFVKLEALNPGGSIKDRIGPWLVADAEKRGVLKPGGTIVESTSGNTGVGLALAAAIKGYKCTFTLPDKMSQEKIRNLRAFGAKVIVTPTAVEPEDPRSYYSVARRTAEETPNAFYVDQYNNLANRQCHYETTGPEVLEQMPNIDVFIGGIGTGGTICGTGKYLREKRPECEVVAVDPMGSIVYDLFKHGKEVSAKNYVIEGIGEDFIPANYDFDIITDMVQVEDKESFVMTRELLYQEALFVGISSGSAVVGALKWIREQGDRLKGKNILVVLPDSGNRYLSKVFDDDWMREQGFIEDRSIGCVTDLLKFMRAEPGSVVMAKQNQSIGQVVGIMREKGISQLPVEDGRGWIKGVITEDAILKATFEGRVTTSDSIENLVDTHVEYVHPETPIEKVSKVLTQGKFPLVSDSGKEGRIVAILTNIDLLSYMGHAS